MKKQASVVITMPTIAERLKKLDRVDDAGLMAGYRFLVTPRRKRSGAKAISKKAASKTYKASVSSRKLASKSVSKKSQPVVARR